MSATREIAATREALAFVRATGATIDSTAGGRVVLTDGERERTLEAHRFADYRDAKKRRLVVARAYILPAAEEDGMYAHAAWIGSVEPPAGTPALSRTGTPYLRRYVRAHEGDGTWISVVSSEPLNDGRIERGAVSSISADFVELQADVVVADLLLARGEYFAMYNYTKEFVTAYVVAHSPLTDNRVMHFWADRQTTATLSVPRSSQGDYVLSASVSYGADRNSERRYTAVSVTLDNKR